MGLDLTSSHSLLETKCLSHEDLHDINVLEFIKYEKGPKG